MTLDFVKIGSCELSKGDKCQMQLPSKAQLHKHLPKCQRIIPQVCNPTNIDNHSVRVITSNVLPLSTEKINGFHYAHITLTNNTSLGSLMYIQYPLSV